jgi:PAS domain S-box-containing protein
MKILLIDDDEAMHTHSRSVLQSAGHELITASDGEEGLRRIRVENPDLVILDYLMPVKNGVDTFRELQADPIYQTHRDTPVIMLTAVNHPAKEVARLLEQGLDVFLEKPFGKKELINIIENTYITNSIKVRNRKLKELAESSRNFLENLVESCPVAILTTNRAGEVQFASQAVNDILGYSSEAIQGQYLHKVLNIKATVFKDLAARAEQHDSMVRYELTVESKNGQKIPMGLTFSELKDNFRKSQGLLVVGQDLSDQKRLEKELVEKERLAAITESLATINHQINNPLTPILGNVQLILNEKNSLDKNHVRKLDIIKTNAKKISEIIKKFNKMVEPIRKRYYDEVNMLDI